MAVETGAALSHYRLLGKIGEGGMGVVWRARDTALDREVAIKLLSEDVERDPQWIARLRREARAVAALNHPNIVTIYSIDRHDNRWFITMELLRGRPLGELVPEGGLSLARFLDLAIPIVDAIGAAHDAGITHGDLKPSNVMVTEGGQVKILDFGLARVPRRRPEIATIDETTVTLELPEGFSGTLRYMSPEQLQGRPVDRRSDTFSLGVLLYEMATGRAPFRGQTAAEVIASTLKDRPRPLTEINAELPRELDRLVQACLEKDPGQRFASALELRQRLDALRRDAGSVAETVPSIAVLPFIDMSPEKDQDYFCEGLAEEIVNALCHVRGLRVASRTSSFQFKDAALDSREIADRLSVRSLLEGSVRKAGDRLRVSAQLIDARSGYHLWSERYDRELKDVFAIQDEIAHSIVAALEVTLSPSERRAIKQVATADPRAFDYYLRGRKFFYQYRRRGVEFALQMFRRAIELDPSYALAWAGIADCCSYLYMNAVHVKENICCAEEASRKALELDGELTEAHVARGAVLSQTGRQQEARRAFEAALARDPRSFEAHYFYAREAFAWGRREEAIRLYERAYELRPEDYQAPLLVAQIYDDLGRREDGDDARRRGIRAAQARLDLNPDDVRALYMAANAMLVLGDRGRGLEWADRALHIEPDEPMLLYNLTCIYSLAGETDRSLDCLERAIDLGFAHLPWVEQDSNLDNIRGQPRFRRLLDRLRRA